MNRAGDPLVEIQGLNAKIDTVPVLKDVTFRLFPGEYVSLVGPNGSGKTSLLRCMNKMLPAVSGRIKLGGKPLEEYSQRRLARITGYLPQSMHVLFPQTVYEFVALGRYVYLNWLGQLSGRDIEVVEQTLNLCGLSELATRDLSTLSGGERQLVFVAAALVQEPRLLLLDEPTTYLDPLYQARIHGLLERLRRESGITIFAATHDVNAGAIVADRVLGLKAGAVCFDGRPADFMQPDVLRNLYEREFTLVAHPVNGIGMIVPSPGEDR